MRQQTRSAHAMYICKECLKVVSKEMNHSAVD